MRQKTETLPERVVMEIWQCIIENEMKAGGELPNKLQIAEYYEVGRGTVRDAVKPLRFEGLVEAVQSGGTYPLRQKQKPIRISEGETSNFLGVFLPEELPGKALEFSGVRLVLEPDITAPVAISAIYEDYRKLMELKTEVRQQIQMQESHYEKDVELHFQIARCPRNKIACRLMEIVVKGIPLFCKVTNDELANQMMKFYHMISEPIERGDASGARYSMIDHLNSIRRKVIEEIE